MNCGDRIMNACLNAGQTNCEKEKEYAQQLWDYSGAFEDKDSAEELKNNMCEGGKEWTEGYDPNNKYHYMMEMIRLSEG